ncbi:hypothetical protein ACFPVS_08950 [Neisseria weixii]|uniref:hypothetical protein n=1 Tax=Neisseria weixii TaxID=1853276 RepID=UPI000BB69423|nr:hypothetical protein [Neisseria weixii]ATD64117.1 hypothetical protein CGZ65_00030 [Neisseria weixii]ATD65875.1 hypothetical protein CGZ65_12560 [Neisseria weixii]
MADLFFRSRPVFYYRQLSYQNHLLQSNCFLRSAHHKYGGKGCIAGEADGIVTVDGQPASRRIYLFALPAMECIADTWSKPDGSYRFDRLNTDKEYMMVARDYKKQYEPVSYDYIKPYVDSDG